MLSNVVCIGRSKSTHSAENLAQVLDRQLAGRCGRQGDPGSVSIFVSAEDGLVKRFGAAVGEGTVRALRASTGLR